MEKEYDIILKAEIEIGGKFLGETAEDARSVAVGELRAHGIISNVVVERCLYIDGEDGLGGEGGNYTKGDAL